MKDILDAIGRPVVVIEPDRRVRYANSAALKAVGRERLATGMHCKEFFSSCPVSLDTGKCLCQELAKDNAVLRGRYSPKGVEGHARVYDTECSVLEGDGAMVVSLSDVTEASRVEDMLERSAEGLTVLYELSNTFLTEKKMEHALELGLNLLLDHYGADIAAVAVPLDGMKEMEYISVVGCERGISAGTRDEVDARDITGYSMLERSPAMVVDYGGDKRFRRSGLFESCGVESGICLPMAVGDVVVGVLCFLYLKPRSFDTAELWYLNVVANTLAVYIEKERSLQKLEESQSYITSVLEGIGDGVIVVDRDFNITFANRAFSDSQDRFQEEVIGSKCYRFAHGKDKPCYEIGEDCPVRAALETGESCSAEHANHDSEGNETFVRINAYPIFDPSGNVVAAVESVFDITERVSLEHDLEKRVGELEEFYDMAVGRELRMVELKEDIEKLEFELGRLRNNNG